MNIIGHRGAAAYAPENTIASFDKALSLGCRVIEFDVVCTADGQPFLLHDHDLKRTSNGRGKVASVEASYLEGLDAGSWFSKDFQGEKIPRLQDALAWLSSNAVQANIEIKPYPGRAEQTTGIVLAHIQQYWPQSQALPLISSFTWEVLVCCKNLAPQMPLGFLLHQWDKAWLEKAKTLECKSLHLNKKIVSAERVKAIKDQGYRVYVYTVNNRSLAKKFYNWGVDALFSDYPDLIRPLNSG
jgi:glycerophosphoryl diester phosphodiesterase